MSAWLGLPIHRQDVSAVADSLAFYEAAAPVALDRHEPLNALTAAQVQDLRIGTPHIKARSGARIGTRWGC
jgi:hypothetical protein